MLLEGYRKASENFKARESEQKNTAGEAVDSNYSIKEDFYKQLMNWDKKTIGFSFVIGTTSKVLQSAGIPNTQIRFDSSKIIKTLNAHKDITIDVIKKIPELLENPIIVCDSKSDVNPKIVLGELYSENDKIVTVVLKLKPSSKKGNELDIIKISSVEGRSHIQSLFKNSDGSYVTIRYTDKNRIRSWLNVNRLQLPLRSFNTNSTNSISEKSENVNSPIKKNFQEDTQKKIESQKDDDDSVHSQELKNWFGDWQNDSRSASKVVNADGTPKIMYHGSQNSFTAFDNKKAKSSGLYGKGLY